MCRDALMLTRAKARIIDQQLKMENAEQAVQPSTREESSQSEEINNQLGMNDVFEETTQLNVAPEDKRGGGQPQMMLENAIERMFMMLQKQREEDKQDRKQEMQKQREEDRQERKREMQQMEENNQKRSEEMKAEIRTVREEIVQLREETKKEIQDAKRELRTEMHQMRDEIRAEVNVVREDGINTQSELQNTKEAVNHLRSEVMENRREIATNTRNLSDNLNRINHELRKEIQTNKEENTGMKKSQEEMERRIQQLREAENKKMEEITTGQEQLTRRISEVEGRPSTRGTVIDNYKDLTFTGDESYPMEFLKELKEIRQLYYQEDEIRWITRYLSGEAVTWFRIIKNEIQCFAAFEELFIEKYWGSHIQESVRDRLEYGKYRPNGGMSATQYMQKHILQCRQLVPPISDQHLIKKLARHYGREFEVATFTRGIKDIPRFENLLRDYTKIISYNRYNNGEQRRENTTVKTEGHNKGNPQREREGEKVKQFDRNNFKQKKYCTPTNDERNVPGPSNTKDL